jgi:DNA processing protein
VSNEWYEGLVEFEIGIGDAAYPEQLLMTPSPPERLRGFGDVRALVPGLAVVGARKATPYGLSAARLFAGWAADVGYTVISGAAIGCDQAAHQAALDVNGRTVAVLGSGADVAYPRGAAAMLREIAQGGCVVSELDWGHPPAKWTFRARNRIIAGLAGALLVLEAGVPSGTFITADEALACGRDVLVVPGSVFAPECRGPNRLLRQGATPITDVSELADALRDCLGEPPMPSDSACGLAVAREAEDRLLAALRTNPARPDDAARSLGMDIVSVARRIGRLEASGAVKRFPDGRYGACS